MTAANWIVQSERSDPAIAARRSSIHGYMVFRFQFFFSLSPAIAIAGPFAYSCTHLLTHSDTHIFRYSHIQILTSGLDRIGSASISQLCVAFGVWKLLQSLNARSTHDPHGWRSIISGVTEPLKPGAWPIYLCDRGVNGGGTQNRFPLSNGALELEFYLKHSYLIYFLMCIINCHWIVGNLLVSNTIFS